MADWKELSNREFIDAVLRESRRRRELCFVGIFTDVSNGKADVIVAKDWPLPGALRELDDKPWELLRHIAEFIEQTADAGLMAHEKLKRET